MTIRSYFVYFLLFGALLLIQCSEEITTPSNTAPHISALPTLVARIGEHFQDIALDTYVQDEDPDSMISWSLTAGLHVSGEIENRVLSLSSNDSTWTGTDVVMLQATDSDGLASQTTVSCHVVDPAEWEHRNSDGTMTITWSTGLFSNAIVRFGTNPNHLQTEARSLHDPDTLHQVRLLGVAANDIVYYQAVNYDLPGFVVFESPVDSFITGPVQPDDMFRVSMIDVRQGDGFLLVTPSGIVIVIDGGYGTYQPYWGGAWSGEGHPFALEYLQNQGIDHVDHMVETHHDMDHWGGLRDIQNAMPVTYYYSPSSPGSMDAGESWDLPDTLLTARVLSVDYPPGVPPSGDNNRSIVLWFEIGTVSFLFTGDAEREVESWAVTTYGDEIRSTVLKVGHHGSSTSSEPEFLNMVQPEFALISCGAGNPYGHPHTETMDALDNVGAVVYRTDLDGDVTIRTDGRLTFETTR